MASSPDALKPHIIKEFGEAFGISDAATLEKFAEALSKAVHTYITTDVQTAAGQPLKTSLSAGATSGPGKLF